MFRATVRDFVEKEIDPHADEWEAAGSFPAHELFPKAAALGLLGLEYDPAYGGQGADHTYTAILGEELGRVGSATTGYEDLRNIAIGRLFLDNIAHVKTHWPMVTPFLSQVALSFGCDDVEGTVIYERVYHEAGAQTDMGMSYAALVELIRRAGKRPVERDSLYRPVRDAFDDLEAVPVVAPAAAGHAV